MEPFSFGRSRAMPDRNQLLALLSADDLGLLSAHLEPVDLEKGARLELPGRAIDYVYFLDSGVASVVAARPTSMVEVGIIGHEGVTGIAVIHGTDRPPYSTQMQIAGSDQRITARKLAELLEGRAGLRRTLLAFAQSYLIQVSENVVANARGS